MKLTKTKLKEIIREELLNEASNNEKSFKMNLWKKTFFDNKI